MKRLLLDQGLSPLAALILREQNWDAIHVSELGLSKAEDVQILDAARQDGRICVTLDHDFHAHLAITRAGQPSVVATPHPEIGCGGAGISHSYNLDDM